MTVLEERNCKTLVNNMKVTYYGKIKCVCI